MRRPIYAFATAFAAFACAPHACAGGMLPGIADKEKALGYSPAGVSGSSAGKATAFTYGAAAHEDSTAKFQVNRGDRRAGQLGDTSELRYRYALGSTLAVSARPRHFGVAWQTRF